MLRATGHARMVNPEHSDRTPRRARAVRAKCSLAGLTTIVGLQPTVIASRAPHLLIEQSVMRFKA